MRRARVGSTLLSVLVLAGIAALAAFTLAAVTTSSLHLAYREVSSQDALYLAEAAIQQTMARLRTSSSFSDAVPPLQPDPQDPGRTGTVTFQRTPAGTVFSTNNYDGSNGTGFGGQSVPQGMIDIIGVGTSHGTTRTVEALLKVPQFPYVLASSGPLNSSGGLTVRSAASMRDFASQETSGQPGSLPASMGCNATVSASGGKVVVTGDVVAAQQVALPPDAVVGGQVRTSSVDLPQIDPTQWDPSQQPGATEWDKGNYGGLTMQGQNYTPMSGAGSPNLNINGNLVLSGALLYVNGTLTVAGGISGNGVVVVRGSTTLGGADLDARNLVGLVSMGDVNLTGDGHNYFQGLVYSGGAFNASNVTIAGTFVAGGGAKLGSGGAAGPGMSLSTVKAVYVPQAAQIQLTLTSAQPMNWFDYNNPGAGDGHRFWPYDSRDNDPAIGVEQQKNVKAIIDAAKAAVTGDRFQPLTTTLNSSTIKTDLGHQSTDLNTYDTGVTSPSGADIAVGVNYWFFDVSSGRFGMLPQPIVSFWYGGPQIPGGNDAVTSYLHTQGVEVSELVGDALKAQQAAVQKANDLIDHAPGGGGGSGTTIDLTLNQFLRDTFPMQIISWRER